MDITYTTINGVKYAFATYREETFQTIADNVSEEEIQSMFANLKRIIDEQYETLNSKDKEIEEARNQQQHIVLVDLKQQTQPIGDI
tara:strand:- start:6718 stop:6975 length:258 start_codon:yes stop_codon:yes gene_type:complete